MKTFMIKVGDLAGSDRGAFKIGPFGSSLKKTELVEKGIPVAGIENVLPNNFVPRFRRYITVEKFAALSDYKILPDDVLVTTMGTIGRAAVAPDLGVAIIDSHLFRMRVDKNRILPEYLCFAINSDLVIAQLSQMSRGSIMDGLNTTILKECVIPLPPMEAQEEIVAQLKAIKKLCSLYAEQLRQADHLFQSLLHQVFCEN